MDAAGGIAAGVASRTIRTGGYIAALPLTRHTGWTTMKPMGTNMNAAFSASNTCGHYSDWGHHGTMV